MLSLDIIEKILSDNPSRESSILSLISSKNDLSLDETIKILEPTSCITYIVSKLLSIKNKRKLYGFKQLIDKYVDDTLKYDIINTEIIEFYNCISQNDIKIYVEIYNNHLDHHMEISYKCNYIINNEDKKQMISKVKLMFDIIDNNNIQDYDRFISLCMLDNDKNNNILESLKFLNEHLDTNKEYIEIIQF